VHVTKFLDSTTQPYNNFVIFEAFNQNHIMKTLEIGIAILLIAGIGSCKKGGCTDSSALNYSSVAKKDDGSCILKSDLQSETEAKVFKYTLQYFAGDTYKDYTGITGYDDGDIIVTFIEDPNEQNLTGFWVQTPYENNDGVKFFAEITDLGTVYLNTTTSNGSSPWNSNHYFNCKSVLIKASGLAKNPNLDLTNYEEIRQTFQL
jgi:hypothetical protein